jgi:hypothetical protein
VPGSKLSNGDSTIDQIWTEQQVFVIALLAGQPHGPQTLVGEKQEEYRVYIVMYDLGGI